MLTPLTEATPRSWDDIPGVALIGILVGLALMVAAIRSLFGRRK